MNKFCQSCGMPMSRDPDNGGTEFDGTRTTKYCSYCYQRGEFTQPEITTAKQMQTFCINKMLEQKTASKFMAWLYTRGIPRLERWKK